MIIPPAVRPGDVVCVVAPSGPADEPLVWRALGWLAERYRVRFDRGLCARTGYLAGSDARRSHELRTALMAPEVRAVLNLRGGYGAGRFVHELDWAALRARPRWVVGFSDATALHVETMAVGLASLHAPNVASLGRADAAARAAFLRGLELPCAARTWEGLTTVVPGQVRGTLVGGNLTLLHACAAAGRLRFPPGAILLIEDVTERPYRVDRMLTTLALGGHLRGVVGVVAGEFTDCTPGPDGVTVDAVLRDRLGALGIPAVMGAPVGHGRRNEPVVLGAEARLAADAAGASVEFVQP